MTTFKLLIAATVGLCAATAAAQERRIVCDPTDPFQSCVEITPVQDFGELLPLPQELVTLGNKHFGAHEESENFTAVHRRIPLAQRSTSL